MEKINSNTERGIQKMNISKINIYSNKNNSFGTVTLPATRKMQEMEPNFDNNPELQNLFEKIRTNKSCVLDYDKNTDRFNVYSNIILLPDFGITTKKTKIKKIPIGNLIAFLVIFSKMIEPHKKYNTSNDDKVSTLDTNKLRDYLKS